MCSKHPEYDHHDDHHHPAVANGDHLNQGHLQKVQRLLEEKVQVKYKQPYVLDWIIHCASKTYICQTTVLKIRHLNFKRVVILVYSLGERKKTFIR